MGLTFWPIGWIHLESYPRTKAKELDQTSSIKNGSTLSCAWAAPCSCAGPFPGCGPRNLAQLGHALAWAVSGWAIHRITVPGPSSPGSWLTGRAMLGPTRLSPLNRWPQKMRWHLNWLNSYTKKSETTTMQRIKIFKVLKIIKKKEKKDYKELIYTA